MGITDDGQRYWPRHMRGRPRHMASGRVGTSRGTATPPPAPADPAWAAAPATPATPPPPPLTAVGASPAAAPQRVALPPATTPRPETASPAGATAQADAEVTDDPADLADHAPGAADPHAPAAVGLAAGGPRPALRPEAAFAALVALPRPGAGTGTSPAALGAVTAVEVITPVEVVTGVGSSRGRRLRTAVAIAGAAASGLAACQPVPAQPGQPAPAAASKVAPWPSRVAVAGDSLVVLAALNGGDTSWADTDGKIGLGWEAEHAQPQVDRDVHQYGTSPEVLVVALGQNDATGPGGLTPEDRAQLFTLVSTPHDSACVVLVKPHYAGADPARLQGIEAYRAWVDEAAPARPGTVVVDWRPEAATHPEYLAPDGFHLESAVPAGNRAYTDLLRDGARSCDTPF